MFVTVVRIILGFIAAVLVAGAVQVLFVAGYDDLLKGNFSAISDQLEGLGLLTLLAATQSAVFSAPFAFLAAAIAAWQPIRSGLFFIAAGILIALAAYVASGFAAGLVYWLVAVPRARPASA